jgi:hypothetical protein
MACNKKICFPCKFSIQFDSRWQMCGACRRRMYIGALGVDGSRTKGIHLSSLFSAEGNDSIIFMKNSTFASSHVFSSPEAMEVNISSIFFGITIEARCTAVKLIARIGQSLSSTFFSCLCWSAVLFCLLVAQRWMSRKKLMRFLKIQKERRNGFAAC